jgi:WD40 repeat protein
MSDRFTGHPSSVDAIIKLNDSIFITGCEDGNIRACSIQPNRFIGVIGDHSDFPIQHLCLSNDNNTLASISHDECVKFWSVENISQVTIRDKNKVKSKTMLNKNVSANKGKLSNEGFFSDLIENKNEKIDQDDSSDNDDNDDDTNKSDDSSSSSDEEDDDD